MIRSKPPVPACDQWWCNILPRPQGQGVMMVLSNGMCWLFREEFIDAVIWEGMEEDGAEFNIATGWFVIAFEHLCQSGCKMESPKADRGRQMPWFQILLSEELSYIFPT